MSILNILNNTVPKDNFVYIATFHFKSGNKIEVPCDEITITKNCNDLTGYTIVGKNTKQLMYINIDQIEAITYRPYE